MKPRRSEFMPVRAVVTKVLNELKQRTSEETAQVERLWRELVGGELSGLTRVRAVSRTVVEIEAAGSVVLAELRQFYQGQFLKRLKESGMSGIEKVVFCLRDG